MAHAAIGSDEVQGTAVDATINVTSSSGTKNLVYIVSKGTAAAITLPAPSGVDGTRLTIISSSAAAHVVTATAVWDGTTGANTTGTFQAFAGACTVLIASGSVWLVESTNNVAWT